MTTRIKKSQCAGRPSIKLFDPDGNEVVEITYSTLIGNTSLLVQKIEKWREIWQPKIEMPGKTRPDETEPPSETHVYKKTQTEEDIFSENDPPLDALSALVGSPADPFVVDRETFVFGAGESLIDNCKVHLYELTPSEHTIDRPIPVKGVSHDVRTGETRDLEQKTYNYYDDIKELKKQHNHPKPLWDPTEPFKEPYMRVEVTDRGVRLTSKAERSNHQQMVDEFMEKAGQDVPKLPTVPSNHTRCLRAKLILEEAFETIEKGLGIKVSRKYSDSHSVPIDYSQFTYAVKNVFDMTELVDGCCDLRVVTTGTLSACGVADEKVQHAVDLSNLAKFEYKCEHCGHDIVVEKEKEMREEYEEDNPPQYACVHCTKVSRIPYRRSDGKWIKPPNWKAPKLDELIDEQGDSNRHLKFPFSLDNYEVGLYNCYTFIKSKGRILQAYYGEEAGNNTSTMKPISEEEMIQQITECLTEGYRINE